MSDLLSNLPLIIFLIVLVNYMVGVFFIVYHLTKFGLDLKTRAIAMVFLAGLAALLFLNFSFFFKVDWLELFNDYLSFPKII